MDGGRLSTPPEHSALQVVTFGGLVLFWSVMLVLQVLGGQIGCTQPAPALRTQLARDEASVLC